MNIARIPMLPMLYMGFLLCGKVLQNVLNNTGGVVVVGSNPAAPTNPIKKPPQGRLFYVYLICTA